MAQTQQHQNVNLKHNQLIWGKLPGLPWWPGQITSNQNQQQNLFAVDFFGYSSNQIKLPSSKIIKYQQFDKTLNTSRMSPALKRAVSQANCLFNAIQQSKNSFPNNLDANTENTILSIGNPEQKSWLIQNSQNETDISNRKIRQNEDQFIKNTECNKSQIKKRKYRKIDKIKQERNQSNLMDFINAQILLNQYGLNKIPLPLQQMLELQQYSSTIKKFYRILKKSSSHNAKVCRQMALKVTEQIIRNGQWRALYKEYRYELHHKTIQDKVQNKFISNQ